MHACIHKQIQNTYTLVSDLSFRFQKTFFWNANLESGRHFSRSVAYFHFCCPCIAWGFQRNKCCVILQFITIFKIMKPKSGKDLYFALLNFNFLSFIFYLMIRHKQLLEVNWYFCVCMWHFFMLLSPVTESWKSSNLCYLHP